MFIKVLVALVFGFQTLKLIDFTKFYWLKGLKPKNQGYANFYECWDLTKSISHASYQGSGVNTISTKTAPDLYKKLTHSLLVKKNPILTVSNPMMNDIKYIQTYFLPDN